MSAAALWLCLALALGVAELLAPGVFLIFLALAAAVTGATLLAMPDLPLVAQLGSFGVWAAVTVVIGRHWYGEARDGDGDALLNDRAGRLTGELVTVETPIASGSGRVRVGDGVWLASGPDTPAGERMRVVGVRDAVLLVEPIFSLKD